MQDNHVQLKKVKGSPFFMQGVVSRLKSCKPFVKNQKAKLIHRPISITVHKSKSGYHMAIHYACGLMACGSKKFTFLEAVDDEDVVCERCETMAVERYKHPSSISICKKHVHLGGLKVHKTCGCANHE